MESSETTDRLLDGLVEDLEPVTPLPRLRSAFAVVIAIWAAVLGIVLSTQEYTPGAAALGGNRVYLASFLGLLLAAIGATASALAAGRPGRERIENGGLAIAGSGLLVGGCVCLFALLALEGGHTPSPPGADAMCFQTGAMLSLLPAGVILSFLVRGWATRPVRAGLVGLLAAGVLGAAIVHLSCDFLAPGHLLRGHMTIPIVLTLVAGYPIGVLVRRFRG